MRKIAAWLFLLSVLLPLQARADAFSNPPPATPPDGTTITISGGKLVANNTGCSTNCTFSGTTTVTTLAGLTGLNNWAPVFGVRADSTGTPAAAGSGYAVGDSIVFNDGCSVHASAGIHTAPGGGVGQWTINNPGVCATVPSNPVSVLSTTGAGTGATFNLSWGMLSAGILGQSNNVNNNGGNLFLMGAALPAGYHGNESVIIGGITYTGAIQGGFDTIVGFGNAWGQGLCGSGAVFGGNSIFGSNAARNSCGQASTTLVGTSAMHDYQGNNSSGHAAFGNVGIGADAMRKWNGGDYPYNTIVGTAGGYGVDLTTTFSGIASFGAKTGAVWTTNTNGLILAGGVNGRVGNTTWATGSNVILMGAGNNVVDTPASNTSNYINIENILTVTGTNAPSTSATTIAGGLVLGGATGGSQGTGTLNAQAIYVNGGAVSAFTGTYGVAQSSTQTPAAGGSGYVNNEVLTLADGCTTHAQLVVLSQSSGAVTGYDVVNPGSCASVPANPVAVTSSTGAGTGAAFNLTFAARASSWLFNGNINSNLLLASSLQSTFGGFGNVIAGPFAGRQFTGASSFNVSLGVATCGGLASSTVTFSSATCVGYSAGSKAITGLDAFGSNAAASQASNAGSITAIGTNALQYLNATHAPASDVAVGSAACRGVNGSATFWSGACFGSNTGAALTSAQQFLILGNSTGNATFASGSNVILVGTGANTIDTPAAGTTNWLNINNTYIMTMVKPTLTSGWGTGATIAGTSGATFQITIGTTPSSSAVLTFATAAPTGWMCGAAADATTATIRGEIVPTSTTTATVNFYTRTTGAATAPTASDVVTVGPCNGF